MCYWFKLDDEVNWIDAKDDCVRRDSFLITVGSYHYLDEKNDCSGPSIYLANILSSS